MGGLLGFSIAVSVLMMAFFSIIIVLLVKSLGKQLDGLVCVDVFEEGDALDATVHDHGGVERPFLRRPAETRLDLHGVQRDHGDLVGTPPGSVLLILYALSTQPQN